jgi:hypothetical protein
MVIFRCDPATAVDFIFMDGQDLSCQFLWVLFARWGPVAVAIPCDLIRPRQISQHLAWSLSAPE